MIKLNSNKKALIACIVIAVVMIAVVGGTFAAYSSLASLKGTATVGSIAVTTELTGGTGTEIVDGKFVAKPLNPGSSFNVTMTVTNTGENTADISAYIAFESIDVDPAVFFSLFTITSSVNDGVRKGALVSAFNPSEALLGTEKGVLAKGTVTYDIVITLSENVSSDLVRHEFFVGLTAIGVQVGEE